MKSEMRLPSWAVTVLVTIIMTMMGLLLNASTRVAKVESCSETNKANIDYLNEHKANQEKMEDTYNAVLRLEKKFDNYAKEN